MTAISISHGNKLNFTLLINQVNIFIILTFYIPMKTFICNFCKKEYQCDITLGNWDINNHQIILRGKGKGNYQARADKFCCFECKKEYRANKCRITLFKNIDKKYTQYKNKDWVKQCQIKREQTNLKKYGVKYIFQDKKILIKRQQNLLNKYGVINISQLPEVKIKKKQYWENISDKEIQVINEKKHQTMVKNKTTRSELMKNIVWKTQWLKNRDWLTKFKKELITRKQNKTLFSSKIEEELRLFIEGLGFKTEKIVEGKGDTRFEIDIFIPEKNIGIEFNGIYYHALNGINKNRIIKNTHFNKSKIAQEKGIDLIQIWEDQWKSKKSLIKSILKSRLNVLDISNKIYARKCIIKEIPSKQYKDFCENNHIMGHRNASIKLGLFYNNDLVQTASFSKTKCFGKANYVNMAEYEWIRGCPGSLNFVIGGTSKLFKYFIKNYNPNSILCYADWNLFNGRGYKECGFNLVGYTGPDKFYVCSKMKRIERNPFKYRELMQKVAEGKLFLCYGAGSLKFIWNKLP